MQRRASKLIKLLKKREPKIGEPSSSAQHEGQASRQSPSGVDKTTPTGTSTSFLPPILTAVDKGSSDAGAGTPTSSLPISPGAREGALSPLTTADEFHSTGLKIVYTPPDGVTPLVDIIFIHGLNGNWHKTWLHLDSGIFWPRDLLATDLPAARVLSFGYNADVTKWFGPVGVGSLRNHAISLLSDVAGARRDIEAESRRIVFVVHSLGGLLIKNAICLSESSSEEHLKQIHHHTIGIVFLGTPHRGSDMAVYAKLVADILKVSQKRVNSNILALLKKDSDLLAAVEDDFAIWLRRKGVAFQITCFFEDLELLAIGALTRDAHQVVTKDSARLPGYTLLPIEANHMGMARFRSAGNTGYQRLLGELMRWLNLTEVATSRDPDDSQASEVAEAESKHLKEDCLRSLHYPYVGRWEDTIDSAMPQTFTWAWSDHDDSFATWTHSTNQLYWVRGKPGSGKTTFLKNLVYQLPSHYRPVPRTPIRGRSQPDTPATGSPDLRSGTPQIVIASHFLRFDGSDLSRSREGILRSWLWQILTQREEAVRAVMPYFLELQSTQSTPSWSIRTLYKAMMSAIDSLDEANISLFLFLDALNESSEGNLQIAKFCIELLSKSPTASALRLCVSSRVDADFSYEFRDSMGIVLEDKVAGDIRIYVTNTCSDVVGEPAFNSLVDEIIGKACGVFLWVKLASNELNRGWRRGRDRRKMSEKLTSLPERLAGLYRQILEHMDVDDREDAIKMLSVAVAAVRPLTVDEFQYSFEHGDRPFESLDQPIQKRIEAICSGLLDIRQGSVFLAHETVLEFFVSLRSELARADDDSLNLGPIYLYNSCVWRLRTLTHIPDTKILEPVFSSYAVINLAKHVDTIYRATDLDRDMILPMSLIPVGQWLLWKMLFCSTYHDSLAESPEDGNYFSAVNGLLVLASSHVILRVESKSFHTIKPNVTPSTTVRRFHYQVCGSLRAKISCAIISGHERSKLWYCGLVEDHKFEMWKPPGTIVDVGEHKIWSDNNSVDLVESMDGVNFTADQLSYTNEPGTGANPNIPVYLKHEISRLVIAANSGQDFELRRNVIKDCGPPLHVAAHNCFPNLVSLLLLYGADPNKPFPKSLYGTVLNAAIYGLPRSIQSAFSPATGGLSALDVQVGLIRLLLDHGASPNAAACGVDTVKPQTPLEAIIRVRRAFAHQLGSYRLGPMAALMKVVWMLLVSGARPNVSTRALAMRDADVIAVFDGFSYVERSQRSRGGNPRPVSFPSLSMRRLLDSVDLEVKLHPPSHAVLGLPPWNIQPDSGDRRSSHNSEPVIATPSTYSSPPPKTVVHNPSHGNISSTPVPNVGASPAVAFTTSYPNPTSHVSASPLGRVATVNVLRPYAYPHHVPSVRMINPSLSLNVRPRNYNMNASYGGPGSGVVQQQPPRAPYEAYLELEKELEDSNML